VKLNLLYPLYSRPPIQNITQNFKVVLKKTNKQIWCKHYAFILHICVKNA